MGATVIHNARINRRELCIRFSSIGSLFFYLLHMPSSLTMNIQVFLFRHDDELSKAMKELGVYTSDYDINQLMKRHVSEREVCQQTDR